MLSMNIIPLVFSLSHNQAFDGEIQKRKKTKQSNLNGYTDKYNFGMLRHKHIDTSIKNESL